MKGSLVEVRQPGRKPLYIVVADEVEIGRDCDGLLLADSEVSRRHVSLADEAGELIATDLGSTNGTFLNGTRISGPAPVRSGDTLIAGATEIELIGPASGGAEPGAIRSSGGATESKATIAQDASGHTVVRGEGGNVDARRTSIELVADAASDSRPDVSSLKGDGDTITIVFSDIESSTEKAIALGDSVWFEVLGVHNDIVRRALAKYGGNEIKSQGDGFMLSFPSARRALQFCVEVQRDLSAYAEEHPETGVRIRIGLHTGEAIVDDEGDLFGKHIIVAARIANLADGDQILASGVVKEITATRGDLAFSDARSVELKGIEGSYDVHDLNWRESLSVLA